MSKTGLRREIWKGKAYWVVRDKKGRFVSKTKVKGSKLRTKTQASERIKEKGTFKRGIKIKRQTLTNFIESTETRKAIEKSWKKPISTRPKKVSDKEAVMYHVEGTYRGQRIYASSQKFGAKFARDYQQMKDRAWKNFFKRLDQVETGGYDADEGLKILDQVKNLREGWRYFKVKK